MVKFSSAATLFLYKRMVITLPEMLASYAKGVDAATFDPTIIGRNFKAGSLFAGIVMVSLPADDRANAPLGKSAIVKAGFQHSTAAHEYTVPATETSITHVYARRARASVRKPSWLYSSALGSVGPGGNVVRLILSPAPKFARVGRTGVASSKTGVVMSNYAG